MKALDKASEYCEFYAEEWQNILRPIETKPIIGVAGSAVSSIFDVAKIVVGIAKMVFGGFASLFSGRFKKTLFNGKNLLTDGVENLILKIVNMATLGFFGWKNSENFTPKGIYGQFEPKPITWI